MADFRVGKIMECNPHPESENLYIEKIDIGEGQHRTILSGLQKAFTVEQMKEGLCVVYANLKERPIGKIPSNGMVMCASDEAKTMFEMVKPPAGAKIGERI